MPTRLRALPGRLQRQRDDARGQGRSGSSPATTPRSTRAGSATRAASRSRTCTPPTGSSSRSGASAGAASRPSRWDEALDEAERLLRAARGPDRHRALRLGDGRAVAYALGEAPARRASARTRRCSRRQTDDAVDAFRLPLSAIRDAELVVVSATTRSSSARRSSTSGSRPRAGTAPRSSRSGRPARSTRRARPARADVCRELGARTERARRAAARPPSASILIWSGPGGAGGAHVAALARRARLRRQAGSRAPSTCPRRRTAAASPTRGRPPPTSEAADPEPHRAADRLRRRGRRRPERPRARRARRAR